MDYKKIGIVVAVLAVVAIIGYFVWKKQSDKKDGKKLPSPAKPATNTPTNTAGNGRQGILADSPFVGGTALTVYNEN